MKIIVCIKRVPSERNVKIDKKTGVLVRDPDKLIINNNDKIAINMALKIKNNSKEEVEVIALSMSAINDLMLFRECMAMGVDKVVVLSDTKFRGSDAWATVNVLKAGIDKIGDFDLILTGEVSSDGETGQVGIRLADKLNINCLTSIENICYANVEGFGVKRKVDNKIEIYNTKEKLLCTVRNAEIENTYLSLSSISKAYKNENIFIYSMKNLNLNDLEVGLDNSTTYVKETHMGNKKGECKYWNFDELVKEINKIL